MTGAELIEEAAKRAAQTGLRTWPTRAERIQREFAPHAELIEAARSLKHCSHACLPPCPHTLKYERMIKALAAVEKLGEKQDANAE